MTYPSSSHYIATLVRVGSSSVGSAINFHEDPLTKNPKEFCVIVTKKIVQKKLGIKDDEPEENMFAKYGTKREPDVLRIHERITGVPLNEVNVKECSDTFLGELSISRPDAVFIERETGKNFRIPVEAKTKHYTKEIPKNIPPSHLVQVMFHIMCMDSLNKNVGKTPFGHYIHVKFSNENEETITNTDDVFALRIMRNDRMIEEIRKRLKILYFHYIFEEKIPEDSLFSNRTMPTAELITLENLFEGYHSVVASLLK